MIFKSPEESIKGVLNYVAKLPFAKRIVHKLSEAARGKCVVFFSLH